MDLIQIESVSSLVNQVSSQMHDHGWAMVATEYEGLLYHFTVGLEYTYEHPNLEAFGLDGERGKNYLETLVERIKGGQRYRAGDFISDLAKNYDLFLLENPANPEGPPITGGRLRLVWPDAEHRYPWDAGCTAHCAAQTFIPPITGIDLEGVHLLMSVLGKRDLSGL